MTCVQEQDFTPASGLCGRAFQLTAGDAEFSVFFALPEANASFLSTAPDVILPYAAMLALVHGEDLNCGGMTADSVLLRNMRCALEEVVRAHSGFRVPQIVNVTEAPVVANTSGQTGVFFSGGIDSFFSVLRHRKGGDADGAQWIGPATHAIHIYHTPEPVGIEAFETLAPLASAVDALGLSFIPLQSNYMTADRRLNDHWADLAHGAGLATVLHLLSGGLRQGLIGSTHTWGALVPWGSGPISDPLWSGRRMQVIHDDAAYDRVEKTELISQHPEALANLNVCDTRVDGKGYVNCSVCPKCLRTMLTLDLFGKNERRTAPAFDWSNYRPAAFARVFLRTENDTTFAFAIRDRAQTAGRPDIVSACDAALRRGRFLRPIARIEDFVKNSRIGRRYRRRLVEWRRSIYNRLGFATRS